MKRQNNLFSKLISDNNLRLAIEEVNRAHRWNHYPDKPNKKVLWIESTIDERIKELRSIIENGFNPSPVKKKRRYDRNAKKWRDICEPALWPDQYVHHALIKIIEPVMMNHMDRFCCGSIKGRGAHYGIKYLKKWMLNKRSTHYCLELDIRHFYDSLEPQVVLKRMKELIKDYRTLDLIERVTSSGIMIGFYTSQWFANTVLQPLDRIVRKNKATHYIRYIDNFIIFSNRKKTLRRILKIIKKWLNNHGLSVKGNWQIFSTDYRLPNALGYKYGHGYTLIRKHIILSIRREIKRMFKLLSSNKIIPLKLAYGILSRLGMLRHCNSTKIYAKYVPNKLQKQLKNIIRSYQKEIKATWSTYLAQYAKMASSTTI